jgi:K+-sensing histidine kinase KdpD
MTHRYSTITIRKTKEKKRVKISSALKPQITKKIIKKWQSLLDLATEILNIPSGLIMKLNKDTIEVFLKSSAHENPYKVGEEAKLIYGLYCETVIGTQKKLIVTNAVKDPVWNANNPDIDLNMISYIGFPINWPDKEVFGTVCLLDNKEHHYSKICEELLFNIKEHIETDLKLLFSGNELKKKYDELEQANRIKSKFLSLISHDVRGSIAILDEFLKLILPKIETYTTSELYDILNALSNNTSAICLTLENLLSWSKNDLLQLKANKTYFNLVAAINKVLKFFTQIIEFKKLKVITDFYSEEIIIHADENMMETSLRNILSNAVKYTFANGKIFIRTLRKGNKTIIEIEDTGVGMNKQALHNLFSYNQFHKSDGTIGEKSEGIGLMLCKEFLDKNNAKIQVESKINTGTVFRITI